MSSYSRSHSRSRSRNISRSISRGRKGGMFGNSQTSSSWNNLNLSSWNPFKKQPTQSNIPTTQNSIINPTISGGKHRLYSKTKKGGYYPNSSGSIYSSIPSSYNGGRRSRRHIKRSKHHSRRHH